MYNICTSQISCRRSSTDVYIHTHTYIYRIHRYVAYQSCRRSNTVVCACALQTWHLRRCVAAT